VRKHTGFAIGGVYPSGHINPIETFLDPDVFRYGIVWAATGTLHHVLRSTRVPLQALSPRIVNFTTA
jgi:prolyl-tRNA editing enzyme YbaK/EbsC (Cys-tRNA(Pro) deacylase)